MNNIDNLMLQNINNIIDSGFVYKKLTEISQKLNLNIDQLGQLNSDTELLLLGEINSSIFEEKINKNLEIDEKISLEIIKFIDSEIISKIKSEIQKNTSSVEFEIQKTKDITEKNKEALPTSSTISAIEKAGQFEIEKDIPLSRSNQYKEVNINREDVLKSIEDKEIIVNENDNKSTNINTNVNKSIDTNIPMIDHLLTTPVNNIQKIEINKIKIENKSKIDPYRESI